MIIWPHLTRLASRKAQISLVQPGVSSLNNWTPVKITFTLSLKEGHPEDAVAVQVCSFTLF